MVSVGTVLLWILSILLSIIYFNAGFSNVRFVFTNNIVAVTLAVQLFTIAKIVILSVLSTITCLYLYHLTSIELAIVCSFTG